MNFESIPWMLILPLAIIELVIMIVAIVDLIRVKSTNGPKWMWAIIIILTNIIGSIIYFIFGRRNE
ncbi:transcriptional regulator [Psychrobacillus glaciei]|uniref:Transcriptional regulator n=1 Tax=Psychrobacillus glaciei TaxID=2283160 RepID=A0A5J6SHQ4_9BACI|nr:PLDc N-terminal domain-containing protein [Psychrobacillus glaciei]QFF97425.1 transcriptional regulator [Psychrobacillus glaciei]